MDVEKDKMRNALILHGAGNNSQGNWFPWLKKQLEQKGYKVWSPDLPHADQPILEEWLDAIFANHDWQFNQDSVLIGHSCGATLILRILERLPKHVKIAKAILVAGPLDKGTIPNFWPLKEGITTTDPYDWQKIKNSCNNFYLI